MVEHELKILLDQATLLNVSDPYNFSFPKASVSMILVTFFFKRFASGYVKYCLLNIFLLLR